MTATDLTTWLRAAVCASLVSLLLPAGVSAQADPNPGALTFTGAFDVPSLYLFRGIRQETDPGLTMWPYADLKIDLMTGGSGSVTSSAVNFGVWNSLHTGSSGSDPTDGKVHYEEDFYAAFTLGFAGATSFTTQYTAYTSPNGRFTTVKEVLFKVAQASRYAPYGLVAFEFDTEPGRGQADGGSDGGTYLELGIGPSWPLGGSTTLAVPVKLGMSLSDYYEHPVTGEDNKFGYFDIGALVTVPLTGVPSRFGSWNVHFGGDYFALGETTEFFNANSEGETSQHKVVGLFGIGVSY
jgi:hypothetical protein